MSAVALNRVTYIVQGEFRVSCNPEEQFSTILGSCVSVCLWDKDAAMGGMNHFLLPGGPEGAGQSGSTRYGINSMEVLINALLRMGARRHQLEAKIFGGARISKNLRDVGASYAEFARNFLIAEDIPCRAESLGGTRARRVIFHPTTGQARQLLVPDNAVIAARHDTQTKPAAGPESVTLF